MTTGSGTKQFTQLESTEAYKAFYEEQGHHCGNHHLTEDFPRARFILDRVRKTDKVLEMGCQTGGITRLIAPHVEVVVANELSDSYRARAAEVLAGIENVEMIDGFAESLPGRLHGHWFDVVVAMELLEHVPDPEALCEAAAYCVARSGKALFSVPKGFSDALGEHVREFTMVSFGEMLKKHFTQVEIVDAGEWYLAEARV